MQKIDRKTSQFRTVIVMYTGTVLFFAILYMLRVSSEAPISFLDSFFLSASALSGTGLSTFSYMDILSPAGKVILLIEIQMGCIGIMALFTYLFMAMGKEMSLPQLMLTSVDQNQKGIQRIQSIVLWMLLISIIAELVGFAALYPIMSERYPNIMEGIFVTLFHSVSSFANAGFDLFGTSMLAFQHDTLFLIVTTLLIFVGVMGFPTIIELFQFKRKNSLFTKANLVVQLYLVVIGFLGFLILEYSHTLNGFPFVTKAANTLFFSVSSRNAGLVNLDIANMSSSGFMLLLFLMFIGTSSGSTGGGIRTTTFAVLVSKGWSIIKGHQEAVLFKKTIPDEDVNKALIVFFGFLLLFCSSTLLIASIENFPLKSIVLEVMSALTTAGISSGITAQLSWFSKVVLIVLMIVGRLGIISFIYFMISTKKTSSKYIRESIIVG